jgi:hypothetical protein
MKLILFSHDSWKRFRLVVSLSNSSLLAWVLVVWLVALRVTLTLQLTKYQPSKLHIIKYDNQDR